MYSETFAEQVFEQLPESEPTQEDAVQIMKGLDANSATGPDGISARVLKRCARVLSLPIVLLARAILQYGHWPSVWEEDWILPLYKKKSQFDPQNYRGIHLTAQLSKVMERLLGQDWMRGMSSDSRVGRNQFAYRKQRGSRDAIAYLSFSWLNMLRRGRKVGVYLSDVSGAFDRVSTERLMRKLEHKGMGRKMVRVIRAWLQKRRAVVVVAGQKSRAMTLKNMFFQGTVSGPPLWNEFSADAAIPLRSCGCTEVIYADDLNAFKEYAASTSNADIQLDLRAAQQELHAWGRANQVAFDAGKESFAVLSRWPGHAEGVDFKILGVTYDKALTMSSAVDALAKSCRWKLRSVLRCRKHFDVEGTMFLYKGRVLPYIENLTPAIYHAADSVLQRVDSIQTRFVDKLGINELEALFVFGLAPLRVRRDIAMLGLIHRTVVGGGTPHFEEFFYLSGAVPPTGNWDRHRYQLREYEEDESCNLLSYAFGHGRGEAQNFIARSVFGLVRIYNLLPSSIVEGAGTVSEFQSMLQGLVKQRAAAGFSDWQVILSPRGGRQQHPLLHMLGRL